MAGELVHFEISANDTAQARAFWSGVFGWSFREAGMPGMEYWVTQTGEGQGGGVMPGDPGSGITVYYSTDDIGASVARVRELGGNAEEAAPIPKIGWFAHCSDPEGNKFSLFQTDEGAGA